tara:strand:+ start:73 stop:435 length:363 start_codon:yes stop_codon:yes gene_type:complete
MKLKAFSKSDSPCTGGSSLKGKLFYGINYNMLVDLLGEPTLLPEDSGDGKVNFEWVVEFDNENFTIYDWKTESPEWSIQNTGNKEQASEWFGGSRWHVGGKTYAGEFIQEIENKVKEIVA